MAEAVDPEIRALRAIEEFVFPLDLDAQGRIAGWLCSRVGSERRWLAEETAQRQIEEMIVDE